MSQRDLNVPLSKAKEIVMEAFDLTSTIQSHKVSNNRIVGKTPLNITNWGCEILVDLSPGGESDTTSAVITANKRMPIDITANPEARKREFMQVLDRLLVDDDNLTEGPISVIGSGDLQSPGFRQQVDDEMVSGWKIKEDGVNRVVLHKPNYGTGLGHVLVAIATIWWTFGFGNFLYAFYSYFQRSPVKVIRDKSTSE